MTTTAQATKTQTATDAAAIIETARMLAERPGWNVPLLAVYEMFDWSIERFHAALRALDGTVAWLEPEPQLRRLTEMDHLVKIHTSGAEWEYKHTIVVAD